MATLFRLSRSVRTLQGPRDAKGAKSAKDDPISGDVVCAPHIGIVAFLTKAGSDGSALLLYHSTFIGDGLGGAHIADELFH